MKKNTSMAKNGMYYVIYQGINVIFPFLTAMYVARILLPETIGSVAYAQNIVRYFSIMAFLGIPTYGLREISKVRNNQVELDSIFSELFIINFISTVVFSVLYILLIIVIKDFRTNLLLYFILGISIAINMLNISWLYEGLEEFEYISLRNIFFKILSFILLIIFVRSSKDIYIYAFITVFGTVGNNVINALYAPKFVRFKLSGLNLKRHLKSIFRLVIVNFAIEIYSLIDVTMIGNFCSKDHVAFYSYGNKIQSIVLQILNAFTVVVVPRLAFLFKKNMINEFNQIIQKTLKIILIFAVPYVVGINIIGNNLMTILYGPSFVEAAYVLKVLSILAIVSPIGYLLGSRVMLVTQNENKMVITVVVGAIVNVIANLVFIPIYAERGAAFASVISEICIMVVYIFHSYKYYNLNGILKNIAKFVVSASVMGIAVIGVDMYIVDTIKCLLIQIPVAFFVYFIILYILKEELVFDFISKMRGIVLKR